MALQHCGMCRLHALARCISIRSWSKARGVASSAECAHGSRGEWEVCVGLELHAQVNSRTKAFSPASVGFAAPPNSLVDPLDAGMPGTLPVLNKRVVEAGVATSLALGCKVNQRSMFDRKHYFYADMPAGYQITQHRVPLAENGTVVLGHGDGERSVRIQRLHLEHDSGKSIHTLSDELTLVDLNRCGVGLMEIVTGPDLRNGDDAAEFVQQVILVLRALGSCDGNIAEGSLRVDANVSVRRIGDDVLGTRCEVKNVAGLRFLSKAIEHERQRQIAMLSANKLVAADTRTFDPSTGTTVRIRAKEDEVDYRYMPEPDLPPLVLSDEFLTEIRAAMPELPRETALRLTRTYPSVGHAGAWALMSEPGGVEYFESAASMLPATLHERLYHWVTSELYGAMHSTGSVVAESPVDPGRLAELVQLVADDHVSGVAAKRVLAVMLAGDTSPPRVVAEGLGVVQVSGDDELIVLCRGVLAANPAELQAYRETRNPKYLKFFVGQAMRASKGSANPKKVQPLLTRLLDE